jgi:hypothetical protein
MSLDGKIKLSVGTILRTYAFYEGTFPRGVSSHASFIPVCFLVRFSTTELINVIGHIYIYIYMNVTKYCIIIFLNALKINVRNIRIEFTQIRLVEWGKLKY